MFTLAILLGTVAAPAGVPAPKSVLGFNVGDDYCLANYRQLTGYWAKLAAASDRVRVEDIGATEEGRRQQMLVVTAPANHKKLARLREIAGGLAKAEGVSPAEAEALIGEGKAVVWIDGGLHANETLCAQVLIETAYRMASGTDAETLRVLNDVVLLLVHANPDGHDLVADWYMREADPKKRSLAGLPRLYQKYCGHDNNRDFYANTQAETRNMNRVMYREWFPQIVYNHHQTGPAGTVLFCPPFRDPFNYNIDPLVISGIDSVGAAMMQRFLVENKPGATTRSGARYSTWWNGGLRTACYFHNMIGLLTETIGSPTPGRIPFDPGRQLPKADYLAPVAPQEWHFRQSVDYSVTANLAVLDYASRNREPLLSNIWRMGTAAIRKGSADSWTITPRVIDAAKAARAAGTRDFEKLLRDPARRDARGYILPANQPDFPTATKFVNALLDSGVVVHRATAAFAAGGKTYPAGSYVVKTAQAFRAHAADMFEPQDHPNDLAYPGGPPVAPYDMAGWTLAFQMGVKFDRVLDGFDGPFEALDVGVKPSPGKVLDADGAVGFFLAPRANDAFTAVNRLLKEGHDVRRLTKPYSVEGHVHPAGFFFISRKPSTLPLLEKTAADLGVRFVGSPAAPAAEAVAVKPTRVGLVDRYGGSMPSGWTRWVLERFEFPFAVVYPPDLDKGGLRDKFDVLIFPDGAVSGRSAAGWNRGGGGNADGGDQPPPDRGEDARDQSIPAEYRGRRGSITPTKTVPELKKFLDAGGTILAVGSSTGLAESLGVAAADHLTARADGKEKSLPRDKFYVPASLLRVKVDPNQPLAWGLERELDVVFSNSPTFRLPADAPGRVAWFDGKTPLRSGWALGQEYLDGGTAVVDAPAGKGRVVLFGPQITFRGQPHGTFKFLFNGIVRAGVGE